MLSKNQIKNITSLHLKKQREQKKLFIAEGEKLVDELLNSSFEIVEIYATESWFLKYKNRIKNHNLIEIDENDLKKISLLSTPNKVLAIVKQKQFNYNELLFKNELSLYLDDIRDPGNLGTIIRLAHWFGIKQIICSENTVEIFNPKVVQSTMGSIFHVPVIKLELADLLNVLQFKINIYGAYLEGKSIYDSPIKTGLLVIGNESNGIQEKNSVLIQQKISIPSNNFHHSESLNAAMATCILLSEYFRISKVK
jgi:TrmH family RNA methyltransferase